MPLQAKYLYIPDDANEPIRQVVLDYQTQKYKTEILKLLGLKSFDEVCNEYLYSEDLVKTYKGQPSIAPGREFVAYYAMMDDNGNSTRPHNKRAADLLVREKTHGPILVSKSILTKDRKTEQEGVVRFETVVEDELQTEEFKKKRRAWMEAYRIHQQQMLDWFQSLGGKVQVINL